MSRLQETFVGGIYARDLKPVRQSSVSEPALSLASQALDPEARHL